MYPLYQATLYENLISGTPSPIMAPEFTCNYRTPMTTHINRFFKLFHNLLSLQNKENKRPSQQLRKLIGILEVKCMLEQGLYNYKLLRISVILFSGFASLITISSSNGSFMQVMHANVQIFFQFRPVNNSFCISRDFLSTELSAKLCVSENLQGYLCPFSIRATCYCRLTPD